MKKVDVQYAIEAIENISLHNRWDRDLYGEKVHKTVIKALEKQIPKKLVIKVSAQMIHGYLYKDKCCYCPTCDSFRGNLDYEPHRIIKYNFCTDCGQALDWSGEDE